MAPTSAQWRLLHGALFVYAAVNCHTEGFTTRHGVARFHCWHTWYHERDDCLLIVVIVSLLVVWLATEGHGYDVVYVNAKRKYGFAGIYGVVGE